MQAVTGSQSLWTKIEGNKLFIERAILIPSNTNSVFGQIKYFPSNRNERHSLRLFRCFNIEIRFSQILWKGIGDFLDFSIRFLNGVIAIVLKPLKAMLFQIRDAIIVFQNLWKECFNIGENSSNSKVIYPIKYGINKLLKIIYYIAITPIVFIKAVISYAVFFITIAIHNLLIYPFLEASYQMGFIKDK